MTQEGPTQRAHGHSPTRWPRGDCQGHAYARSRRSFALVGAGSRRLAWWVATHLFSDPSAICLAGEHRVEACWDAAGARDKAGGLRGIVVFERRSGREVGAESRAESRLREEKRWGVGKPGREDGPYARLYSSAERVALPAEVASKVDWRI